MPNCPEAQRSRRRPARNNITGAQAMRSLNDGRMDGQVAADYLDRMDELERRSRDLELLDDYERVLGIGGVRHERGRP